MRTKILALASLALAVMIAGCLTPSLGDQEATTTGEPFKLAFSVKDDFTQFVEDTQPLADAIETYTDRPVEIVTVQDESAAILSVASGDATAAFLDGGAGWIAWQQVGLEAIAADAKVDGRTYYIASAWVKADSGIEDVGDLEGTTSCHTGELKSAGMLMPMGYLFENGYIDAAEYPDDLSSIKEAREAFFEDPIVGGGYEGAFQCLSEDRGDVAFVRDTTWEDYCDGDDARSWCQDRDDYRLLETFAKVPSHPVMVNPDLPAQEKALLQFGLLSLNDDEAGQAVLEDVLQTPAIKHVNTQDHLGGYGELLSSIPGIQQLFEDKGWS